MDKSETLPFLAWFRVVMQALFGPSFEVVVWFNLYMVNMQDVFAIFGFP